MASYTNFYETVAEANMRLRGTAVLYDGRPYYVLAIANHKGDGIFRIYLEPLGVGKSKMLHGTVPIDALTMPSDLPEVGILMDKFMEDYPTKYKKECPILRKKMNSPLFNKFRPFPLGMCNFDGAVLYFERSPQRRTEQGLNLGALQMQWVKVLSGTQSSRFDFYDMPFTRCILGDYPTAAEALESLTNPQCQNTGVGIHRLFALLKGPAETLFLAHKTDVVGFLPDSNLSRVFLSKEFHYLKEAVSELNLFSTVSVR